jgi:hypothetical protein
MYKATVHVEQNKIVHLDFYIYIYIYITKLSHFRDGHCCSLAAGLLLEAD